MDDLAKEKFLKKEYRILREIPGTSNPVDDFLKPKVFNLEKKTKTKKDTVEIVGLSALGVKHQFGLNPDVTDHNEYGYLDVKEIIIPFFAVAKLEQLGYIEEFEDKFLS